MEAEEKDITVPYTSKTVLRPLGDFHGDYTHFKVPSIH